VRFIAFLSLIRWYNLLLVLIAQFLAARFVLLGKSEQWNWLIDRGLWGLALAGSLLLAGGYVINAFYDIETDLANRPQEVIVGRVISKKHALQAWLVLNGVGLTLSACLSSRLFLFYFIYSGSLWLYSHKLRKFPLIGEIAAAFLCVSAFFAICVHYQSLNSALLILAALFWILVLAREIVKKLINIKGDLVYGYKTFPIEYGLKKTRNLLVLLHSMAVIPLLAFTLLNRNASTYLFAGLVGSGVLASMYLSLKAVRLTDHHRINTALKIVLLMCIGGIVLI
jgi:4-hydroxybenzoate polyprenyltransferase